MTYVDTEARDAAQQQYQQDSILLKTDALHRRLLHADQIEDLPAPEPLIRGVLYQDSLVELFGKPGCGKSFIALDWACHVATGKDWQGHQTRAGTVLYIVGEGAGGMGKRRKAWRTAWHLEPDDLVFLREPVPFLDEEWMAALCAVVRPTAFDLIVVDTLSRSIAGHNENDSTTMSKLVEHADILRAQSGGACVLFVHHSTKDGATNRGHSALEGACDVRWKVSKDSAAMTLSNEKTKDEEQHGDLVLALRAIQVGKDGDGCPVTSAVVESHSALAWGPDLPASEQALVTVMRDSFGTTGATPAQLRDVSGLSKTTFYRALNALVERRLLTNTGTPKRPHYFIGEDPNE